MKSICAVLIFGDEHLVKHKVPAMRRYKLGCGQNNTNQTTFPVLFLPFLLETHSRACSKLFNIHTYARIEKWNLLRALCINNYFLICKKCHKAVKQTFWERCPLLIQLWWSQVTAEMWWNMHQGGAGTGVLPSDFLLVLNTEINMRFF